MSHRQSLNYTPLRQKKRRFSRRFFRNLTVVIILIALAYRIFFWPNAAVAGWYNVSWAYRKPITITNNGSQQTNYQIRVTVDTASLISSGKLQSDCDDIRFAGTDGTTNLAYFEEYGCNTSSTLYWVTVDTIAAGSSTIYMYYGNGAATATSAYSSQPTGINYGNGADGAITISADTVINATNSIGGRSCADGGDAVNYSVTENRSSGTNQVVLSSTPSSGCLAVGDEILIINLQGTSGNNSNVGKYETARITTISTATLSVNHNWANSYDGSTQKIMVQRIPNYTNVTTSTAGTDFTASDFDGTKGGVMMLRANGTVSIASSTTINANGAGYRGGSAGSAAPSGGTNGESYDGTIGQGATGNSVAASSGGGNSGDNATASPNNGVVRGGGGGGGSSGTVSGANGGGGGAGGGYGFGGGGGSGNNDGTNNGTRSGGTAASGNANAGGGGGGANGNTAGANGGNAGSAGSSSTGTGGQVGSGTTGGSGGGGANNSSGSGGGGGGGGNYGSSTLTTLYHGSGGGGGGGSVVSGAATAGTDGGGIIFINANTITVSGNIQSNGVATSIATANAGSGGGGAGGSVYLNANTVTQGTNRVSATGATRPTATADVGGGGAGADGRSYITYSTTSGSTSSPTANTAAIPTAASPSSEVSYTTFVSSAENYWNFDEGYGTTVHDSINVNNGTLGGSTLPEWQSEEQCISGKCLYFDGSSSKVTLTGSADVKSIALWVKPNSVSSAALIDLGNSVRVTVSSGTISATGFTSPTIYVNGKVSTTLIQNEWQHVAVVSNTTVSTGTTLFGNYSSTYLQGFMDEIYFSSTAYNATQIQSLFTARGSVSGVSTKFGPDNSWMSNGLVGYWNMDQASSGQCPSTNDDCDLSGNGNDGSWTGNATSVAGKFRFSDSFDGTGDYSTMGNPTALQVTGELSISAWVYTGSTNTYQIIAGRLAAGQDNYSLYFDDTGKFGFEVNGAIGANSTTSYVANRWYYVTGTFTPNTSIKIYVNGVLEDTNTTSVPASIDNASQNFQVGRAAGGFGDLNGKVDELRVYKRALTSSEVNQLNNWAPAPAAYWKFNEGTGASALDSSSFGTTGTLTRSPAWSTGKYDKALNFNSASSQYVSVSDTYAIESFGSALTLEAWIKPTSTSLNGSYHTIVGKSDNTGASSEYNMAILDADTVSFWWSSANQSEDWQISGTSLFTAGQWYHIAMTRDETNDIIKIYVNGVSYTATNTGGDFDAGGQTNALSIGRPGETNSDYFDGTIDEVMIYHYDRTPKQIIEDMNAGHPTVGTPIGSAVGHWSLDEGYGTTAYDKSPLANNLTYSSISSTSSGKLAKGWNGLGTNWISRTDDADFDFASAEDFTLTAWVKSDSASNPGSDEYIVSKESSSAGYAIWFNTNGEIVCGIDDDTSSFPEDSAGDTAANTDYYDANWHHIVCVRNTTTGTLSLYIDGKLFDSDTSLSATGSLENSDSLTYGSRNTVNDTDDFNGDLDELKIYRAALSAADVQVEYNQGKSQVLGALSTSADGVTPDNSNAREYCPPGDTSPCLAPIAEWNMEENSGLTTNDTSGSGNSGTLTKGAAWTAFGKFASAISFDGIDDYVTIPDNSALQIAAGQSISISAWFKTTSNGGTIVGKNGNDIANQYVLRLAFGCLRASAKDGSFQGANDFTSARCGLDDNLWHFATFTYNRATGGSRLYIDGVLDNSQTESPNPSGAFGSGSEPVIIGAESTSGDFFTGVIDQVRIYKYERSATQVNWDYNRGAPIAWYKLDECTGSTANDASGNANTGTITIGASGSYTSTGTCSSGTSTQAWNAGSNGKYVSALGFDGTDDHILIPTQNGLSYNSGTISSWVYPTASSPAADEMIVMGNRETNRIYLKRSITTGTLRIQLGTDSAIDTGKVIPVNTWSHVAMTWNNGTYAIYMNGVRLTNGTYTVLSSLDGFSSIGSYDDDAGDVNSYFAGMIDDVRFYNYAVNTTQLKSIVNQGSAIQFAPISGIPQ